MNTGLFKGLVEHLRQPEEMVVLVLGLLLVKSIDPSLYAEALDIFNPLIPHVLPLLKLFCLLMAFGGIAGIVLSLLCWVLDYLCYLSSGYLVAKNPVPPAWYLRTVNGIVYSSFSWMWLSLGLIYLLGGPDSIPRFVQTCIPSSTPESVILADFFRSLALVVPVLVLVVLLCKTFINFITPRFDNSTMNIRITEPFSIRKIEEPVAVTKPEDPYQQSPGYHSPW